MSFCRKVSSVSDALRCLSLSAVARGVETPSSHLSAVKRPANSYVIFKTEKLKTIPTMSLADSNKELGKQWKQLTPAEKRHYQAVLGIRNGIRIRMLLGLPDPDPSLFS
jgi:hypothetical protein